MTWPNGVGVSVNNWGPWEPVPASGPPPVAENVAPPVLSPPAGDQTNGQLNTQYYLSEVLAISEAQQGTAAISNVASITDSFAGIAPAQIAVNNFTAGSDGTTGTKFS